MDVMKLFGNLISWVLGFLPDSPFVMIDNSPVADYIGYINYFFPISFMISTAEAWLTAVAVYYIYSAVLRWIKAIS